MNLSPRRPGGVNSNYAPTDVRRFVKIELLGHHILDQPNVLNHEKKETLQGLVGNAEATTSVDEEKEGQRRETEMIKPLYKIFEQFRKFGGDAQFQGEADTFTFPQLAPDFTICDVSGKRNTDLKPGPGTKNIWRVRYAFIELEAISSQGLTKTVTDIVAQVADYARLHKSRFSRGNNR